MGLSLSLDGGRQARSRRRGGQHTRTAEDQACLDALAAFLHSDTLSASRSLSKVSTTGLASRLLPAAIALARATDLALAADPSAAHNVALDFVLSPACLLGLCQGSAGTDPCTSPACQHRCHSQPAALPAGPAAASHDTGAARSGRCTT